MTITEPRIERESDPQLSRVAVKREPLTYEPDSRHSFIWDRMRVAAYRDEQAETRLARHQIETRTNPNTTDGTGGEFAVPLWAIPLTGPGINAGRIIPDLLDRVGNLYPLPRGINQVNVPVEGTGAVVAVQSGENTPAASQDPTTSAGTSKVVTISGAVVASQQLLDQTPTPGFDQLMLNDLMSNYNATLETQLLTGTNVNGQLLGLLNVSNIVKFAAGSSVVAAGLAGASNMITGLTQVVGSLLAQTGNARQQAARHILMSPRRWAAVSASLDQQSRPVVSPGHGEPEASSTWPDTGGRFNYTAAVGPWMGCPIWQSGVLGPASNSSTDAAKTDTIVVIRPRDLLMWESVQPGLQVAVEPLAGTLQVRVQLHKYVAFVSNRYPSGIGAATGLIQPTSSLTGVTF